MTDLTKIKQEIIEQLLENNYRGDLGDLGDIGNEIGIVIGKWISTEMGFDKESFISGVKHGISLIDGTHDEKS